MNIPRWLAAAALSASLASTFTTSADDSSATIAALLKRIGQLEEKVVALENNRSSAASPAPAPSAAPVDTARIASLEQQVKVLDRKNELANEAASEKAKTAPVLTAVPGGFQLRSADTNFVIKLRGYAQADARFFPDDNAGGTVNDQFLMRRVRPILEGTLYEKYDFRIMTDFASGITSSAANNGFLQDGYLTARFYPEFQVQAGKFKEPVGLERLQSGANLLFIERAYPTQLVPNRDVGFQVQGDLAGGRLNYQVGAFNGVANGGSGDADTTDDDKDIAARLFATPFKDSDNDWIRGLGFGVAGTIGDQEGNATASNLRNAVSPGQQRLFGYRSGAGTNAATANVVADGRIWRVSPQFYHYIGPFGIIGEFVVSNQQVRRDDGAKTFAQLENTAWQVAASWFLTGEDNSFKAVAPRKPFTLGGEGWGAFEVAARISQLDIDDATFPLYANAASSATSATSWGVGLNWHLDKNIKASLDYEQTDLGGGSSPLLDNGEKAVLTRAQVSF